MTPCPRFGRKHYHVYLLNTSCQTQRLMITSVNEASSVPHLPACLGQKINKIVYSEVLLYSSQILQNDKYPELKVLLTLFVIHPTLIEGKWGLEI